MKRFSYPDLFRVVYYTFDAKRLVLQAAGLLLALIPLFFFTTLSYYVQGSIRLLPWFLNLVGIIAFYLMLLVSAGPVTYLALRQIQSGRNGSVFEAVGAGFRFAGRLALSPLWVISFIIFCLIVLAVLMALGLLPGAGTLLWSILILPQFIISLFITVGLVTLLAGTLLLPSIIVAKNCRARQGFRELLTLIRKNFFRFWGYAFTALGLTAAYFAAATAIVLASLYLFFGLSTAILGDQPGAVVLNIPPFFHKIAPALETALPLPNAIPSEGALLSASGTIAGFSLLVIYVIWLSYPVLYAFNSGVIIYLALSNE